MKTHISSQTLPMRKRLTNLGKLLQKRLWLLTILTLLLDQHSEAQTNDQLTFSPNGTYDILYDRFGDQYRMEDLLIDQSLPRSMGGNCTNTGYFVLHYDNGSGMEDGNDPIHQARRDVFCQLFFDLSQFIIPSDPTNQVHIWVRNINELNPPPGVLGLATSFYVTPQMTNPVSGIVDGMVWQTINSGMDSYTNVASPLLISADPNNEDGVFYHGMMAFNFAQLWHTDLTTVAATGTFDLYTVGLHEITHALGFASLINDDGQSKLGADSPYYSRYDLFLQATNGQNLITNNTACEMYGYGWNSTLNPSETVSPNPNNLACQTNSSVCANAVRFFGSVNQRLYTPNCYESGSSLSHLEDVCHVPNAMPNDQYYVMSNAAGPGPSFTKRFLRQEERQVLCDIGYSLATSYGIIGDIHHTFFNYGGTICNNNEQIAGINDGIDEGGGYVWVTAPGVGISISGAAILSNDFGESSLLGFTCLEAIIGGGTISVTQGNAATNMIYTPPANSFGLHLLRYIPTDGNRLGNITYIYVFVAQANCEPSACDLINNGGFDEGGLEFGGVECKIFFQPTDVSCWSQFAGSADVLGSGCLGEWGAGFIPTVANPSFSGAIGFHPNNPDNENFILIKGWSTLISGVSGVYEEAVQSLLTSNLIPETSYHLRFWAYSAQPNNSETATIVFCARQNPGTASTFDPSTMTVLASQIVPHNSQWNFYDIPFVCPSITNLNTIVVGFDASNYPPGQQSVFRTAFIDDISIIPAEVGSLDIQPNTICSTQIISDLADFVVPPGGVFSGPGVSESAGIFSFDGSIAGAGTHTIVYEFTNNLGCEIYLTDQITVGNQGTFDVSVAPDQYLCPGQSCTLSVVDPINGATYTWSPSTGLSSTTGTTVTANPTATTTYSATSTNGGCSTNGSAQVIAVPAISATLTIINTIVGQCIGSVTANVTYNGPLTDLSYSWTFNGAPQSNSSNVITNACAGNYSCTITSIYGCTFTVNGIVTSMTAPIIAPVVVNDGCLGSGCGGSISITANLPLTLVWAGSGVNGLTAPTITNLCAGSYVATFTFVGYPSITQTYTITALAGTTYSTVLNNATTSIAASTVLVSGNITVNAGGTLDVSNSTLYFQTNARLIVKAGGILIANNSTFTAGCPSYWSGIEVQGVQDQSQSALMPDPNNTDPVDNFYQGRATLTGKCIISKARIGIRAGTTVSNNVSSTVGTTGGGKLTVTGTDFINNMRDVYFSQYWSFANQSKFTSCQFLTDANYMTSASMLDRVSVWLNRNVRFYTCTWKNTHAQWVVNYPTVNCLYANSGPFVLKTCTFEGFHRGIRTTGIFTENYTYTISDNVFKCYRGVLMENLLTGFITGNTFNSLHTATAIGTPFPQVPSPFIDNMTDTPIDYINNINNTNNGYDYTQWRSAYGLYLQSPKTFTVRDNTFQMSGNANVMRVGMYVNGNDINANDIYRNGFFDMIGGCRFYNDNRGVIPTQDGLAFTCNTFRNNVRDVEINNAPATNFVYNSGYGIRQTIGSAQISRANTFEQLTPNPNDDDDMRNFTQNSHTYYWNTVADELTPAEVAGVAVFQTSSSVGCTSNTPTIGNIVSLNNAISAYDAAKLLYQALVDGGNTELVLTEVELADYADAIALYQSLMAKSPALSQDVMLEAIAKEYDLPAVLLTAILASNPSAAKSAVIQKDLDERQYLLSAYQRELINQGLGVISTKEAMEAALGDISVEAQHYMLAEYLRIADEEPEEQQAAAFESLINSRTDLASQFFKVHALLAQGRYAETEALCNALLAQINPKLPEHADYTDFLALLPLHQSLSSDTEAILSSEQKNDLIAQLKDWKPATYGLALDILTQWSDFEHQEPLDYPQEAPQPRSLTITNESKEVVPIWIAVYPNPASDYLSIRLDKAPLTSGAMYTLIDAQGALVAQGQLGNPTMEYVVTLDKLATGLYTITVYDIGQVMHAQSVIIE
jgi:hypothetical protein